MQKVSSNSSMAISPSAQCRPSMADIKQIFHNAASLSTPSSITSNGKSTSATATSVTASAAKILSLMMIAHKDVVNCYAICLHQLRKIFALLDMSNQVNLLLLIQNPHQIQLFSDSLEQCRSFSSLSSVGGSFEKNIESECWNEGFSCKIQKTQEECNTLLKSISVRSHGIQKFAGVIRSSSAPPQSRASSSVAGPSQPQPLSSPSSSSSFLKPKENSSSSEGEEVIQSVGGEDGEEKYQPRFRLIPVFERERLNGAQPASRDIKLLDVSLYEAYGYFTFAREVWCASPWGNEPNQPTLHHVSCPWLPPFNKTEYYTETKRGREILLDPLNMSWESFIYRVDKIVMIAEDEPLIRLCVFKGENLEHDSRIPKAAVSDSFEKFARAIYFYHAAYKQQDPYFFNPIYFPWSNGLLEYYNSQGFPLDMPEQQEESAEEEEESDDAAEEQREQEEIGEVVEDDDHVDGEVNQESEENGNIIEDEEDDINDAAMEEITPWQEFMENLFSVHIKILDGDQV